MGQVNYNCSNIQPIAGRTLYQLKSCNWCSPSYKHWNQMTHPSRNLSCQQNMTSACHRHWARGKTRTDGTLMEGALRHTVSIKMCESIGAECGRHMQVCRQVWFSTMWVPFCWSYVRHMLQTRPAKICQSKTNFLCYILSSATCVIPKPVMRFYPMQIKFKW